MPPGRRGATRRGSQLPGHLAGTVVARMGDDGGARYQRPCTTSSAPPRKDTVTNASSRRPDGIIAGLLAIAIAAGGGWGIRRYATRLATSEVQAAAACDVPFKYQTLTLQHAALASGTVLPIYGSSELFCCGNPFRPTAVFASRPTAFGVLPIGHAGTADLFFMQTFAALGHGLRGRKLVLSASPPWFSHRDGADSSEYAGNFRPELAYAFMFEAPISLRLRQAGARRMLAYPETLRDTLLRVAAEDLAHPTPMHHVAYLALAPAGHVMTWILHVLDAGRTVAFVWGRGRFCPHASSSSMSPDWVRMAALGTRIAEQRDTTNPFGFPDSKYSELVRIRPKISEALALYQSGGTNRDGALLPPPTKWELTMSRSAEWTDLRLALRVLRELGARPLVWSLPLPGAYDNYTPLSVVARRSYYDRYEHIVEWAKVPWLDFRADEEDPYFLTDPGSHLSARGWVFADRALDMFWHGRSSAEIRSALSTLAEEAPSGSPPADHR
jgi:poly-D-alanine transfer protein DltD